MLVPCQRIKIHCFRGILSRNGIVTSLCNSVVKEIGEVPRCLNEDKPVIEHLFKCSSNLPSISSPELICILERHFFENDVVFKLAHHSWHREFNGKANMCLDHVSFLVISIAVQSPFEYFKLGSVYNVLDIMYHFSRKHCIPKILISTFEHVHISNISYVWLVT